MNINKLPKPEYMVVAPSGRVVIHFFSREKAVEWVERMESRLGAGFYRIFEYKVEAVDVTKLKGNTATA